MKKKTIVMLALLIMLVFAAGYRFVYVFPYPIGGGQYRESPDKKFTASASSMVDRFFFGGVRHYYKFEIEDASHRQIRRIVMDDPLEEMIEWREEGLIEWAIDSSSVTYSFNGTKLILLVNQ